MTEPRRPGSADTWGERFDGTYGPGTMAELREEQASSAKPLPPTDDVRARLEKIERDHLKHIDGLVDEQAARSGWDAEEHEAQRVIYRRTAAISLNFGDFQAVLALSAQSPPPPTPIPPDHVLVERAELEDYAHVIGNLIGELSDPGTGALAAHYRIEALLTVAPQPPSPGQGMCPSCNVPLGAGACFRCRPERRPTPPPSGEAEAVAREALRQEIINTPETADFMAGVPLEAAHQRERWGSDHDAGKTPWDWFWLIGYLAQKAATSAVAGDHEKAKHHTISTAAALANWHAALTGADNHMVPGAPLDVREQADTLSADGARS